jgi:HD-GYP domain-containing protein (c-di-GMP phosphodiesterase class II)
LGQERLPGGVEALMDVLAARDPTAWAHSREVAALGYRTAIALGCAIAQARLIALAGRLHDIGKVALPTEVLAQSRALSDTEWTLMRLHPGVGAEIAGAFPTLAGTAALIRGHHEWFNGRGYPDALAGSAIPEGARIISVADAYSAMTTDRSYRRCCTRPEAMIELSRCAGFQFDPHVVEAFARVIHLPEGEQCAA